MPALTSVGCVEGKIVPMLSAQWRLSSEAKHDSAKSALSQTLQTLFAERPTVLMSHGPYMEEFEWKIETECNKRYPKTLDEMLSSKYQPQQT